MHEESNERAEDGRALRNYERLNRLRSTTVIPTVEKMSQEEEQTTKRVYSAIYRIKNATKPPSTSERRDDLVNEESETNTERILTNQTTSVEESPRPKLSGLTRLRIRTTTTKVTTARDEEEYEQLDRTNESTTRRAFISRNRFTTTTTKTKAQSEESAEEPAKEATNSPNRRRQNTFNRYRTTTAGSPVDAVNDAQEVLAVTTVNPFRRRLPARNRPTTTTESTTKEKEDENELERNSEESTTRRNLITRNRFRTTTARTTTDGVESEEDRAAAPTISSTLRRATIFRNRFATTTPKGEDESEENGKEIPEGVDYKENKSEGGSTTAASTTRRPYAVINRSPPKLTVESFKEDSKKSDGSPDATTRRVYQVIKRKLKGSVGPGEQAVVTKENEEKEILENEVEEENISSTEAIKTNSSQKTKLKDSDGYETTTLAENSEGQTSRLNEVEEDDQNTTVTEVVKDETEEKESESNTELNKNLEDNEETEETTPTTTESVEVSLTSRRPILIRKRIRITTTENAPTEKAKDDAESAANTESTSQRTLVIRKRPAANSTPETTRTPVVLRRRLSSSRTPAVVNANSNEEPEEPEEYNTETPTTRRPYASLNRRRLSTSTTELASELLKNVEDNDEATTQTPNNDNKRVLGQTNRHRALPGRTTEKPNDENDQNSSVVKEPTASRGRNFKSLNRLRSTTEAHELAALESTEAPTDVNTRRTFKRVRTTTTTPPNNELDFTTEFTTLSAFRQRTRPTTTRRPLPLAINRSLYQRNEGPDEDENKVDDDDENSDEYKDGDEYKDESLASVKSTYQKQSAAFGSTLQPRARSQFGALRPYTQPKPDESELEDDDENVDDNYENNADESNESLPTERPQNELRNSLQNIRNRVKASQTRNDNNEGVINSKLQLLLANKAKPIFRTYTKNSRDVQNEDGALSENKDSTKDRDTGEDKEEKRNKFTTKPNVKSSVTSLFASRSNTNRTSTVEPNFKRTKLNLSLKTNTSTPVGVKYNRYSSLVADEAEREADEQIAEHNDDSDVNNDDDNDVEHNTNFKGNDVNSKRRFQKYQYNRSRFTTTTTTSTTTESLPTGAARSPSGIFTPRTKLYQLKRNRTVAAIATTTTENQVNALVDVKGEDDDDDDEVEVDGYYDDDSDGEDESSTTTTTESTPNSIPAPTLRRIRVLKYRRKIGTNGNDTNTISNDSNVNDSNVSDNDSSKLTDSSITNTTNTVSLDSDTLEPKVERARLELTNSRNSETYESDTEGSVIPDSSPTPKRIRKVIRKLIRPVNRTTVATLTEADKANESNSLSDSKLNTTLSGNGAARARFVASTMPTNDTDTSEKVEEVAEEDSETEDEDVDDDEEYSEDSEEITTQVPVSTKGPTLPTRPPFVLTRSTSSTEATANVANEDADEENEEEEDTSGEEDDSTDANVAAEDEEAEVEEDEEEQDVQEDKTTVPPVIDAEDDKNEQRNRLSKLTFTRPNITTTADTNTTEENHEEATPKTVVASTRLKKLLPYVNTTTVITSNELPESSDTDKTNATQPKFIPIRRPFGLGGPVRLATPQKSESVNVSDEEKAAEVTTTTSRAPFVRPTLRRKLIAKRPYVSARPFSISSLTTPQVPTSITTKRKFVRRKFGSFQPFNLGNRNTGAGFVRTDPRSQLLPESNRFRVENGKRVPITDGEKDGEYDEYEDENEDKEEDEEEVEDTKSQTPHSIATLRPVTLPTHLFTRPPIPLLHAAKENKEAITEENGEAVVEDEEDAEEDDEEEEEAEEDEEEEEEEVADASPKITPPKFQPKDNRALPGARPVLTTTSAPHTINVPFNARARLPPSGPGGLNIGNRYGTSTPGNTRASNRPRVINRPQGAASPNSPLKPLSNTYGRTTPVIPTKSAPFIATNTRSYERKYTATSTETPELNNNDNSLTEDINIEALNARNKKIFDINNKKHTTVTPKTTNSGGKQTPTDQEQEQEPKQQQPDTQDHLSQKNTVTENDDHPTVVSGEQGFITTTPRTTLTANTSSDTNTDLYHANNVNEISSQDNETVVERDGYTTPQIPTTTLLHIFTLTDEEQTSPAPTDEDEANIIGRLVPERTQPKHKLVEVNRIVEITSKEEKVLRTTNASQEIITPISSSAIRVESLPHLEQLGEISVVKYVHLVDGSDISVDSHSSVTDYTPTELIASAPVRNSLPVENLTPVRNSLPVQNSLPVRNSVPVRNTLPEDGPYYVPQYAYSTESAQVRTTLEQRNGKALIPDVIRSAVETSTISLEGLFDEARQGRVFDSVNNVYYVFATTPKSDFEENENIKQNENENVTENVDDNAHEESQNRNINTITALPTTANTTTTTTERPYPVFTPHSNNVNNIPNVAYTNLLESTTVVSDSYEPESVTNMPAHKSSPSIQETFSQNTSIADVDSSNLETDTTTPTTPTTTTDASTVGSDVVVKSSTYIRTPTATTIITATAPTRRPLLSVRRRKINIPNASSGIPYQTAITSALTGSTTTSQTATTITTANTFSTKNDDLQIITTELPTTFNKQQQQHQQQLNRNRTKLVAPALTATATATALPTTTTIADITAPPTTTTSLLLTQPSSSSSSSAATIILNSETSNSSTNFKPHFNTKHRAKLLATTLSTRASPTTIITTTPKIEGAAAAAATTTTSNINDIIQTANANTKQPSTLLRRKFQTRRLITTTTLSPTDVSGTDQPRTQNPLFKRRFSHPTNPSATAVTTTPADALTTTLFVEGFEVEDPADQVAKSSISTNHFDQFLEQIETIKEPVARQELTSGIKVSPLKSTFATKTKSGPAALYAPIEPNHAFAESITRRMGTVAETTEHTTSTRKSAGKRGRPQKYTPTTPQTPAEPVISRRAQTVSRRRPNKYAGGDNYDRLNSYQPVPVKQASPGVHRSNHKQIVDYDYYDDDFERVVGNTKGQQLKVILHGRGIIECLDQGNFPHPLSCRKFISCAKFETGGVVGWEYTCPKGLSYDPVGGMCNWSAGLGCKE